MSAIIGTEILALIATISKPGKSLRLVGKFVVGNTHLIYLVETYKAGIMIDCQVFFDGYDAVSSYEELSESF